MDGPIIAWFFLALTFGVPIGGIAGGIVGYFVGKAHLRALDRREAGYAIPVMNLKRLPAGMVAGGGQMVIGQVVIGSDYFKTLFSKIRAIFGGEMRSFEQMVERARREALSRAMAEAEALGAIALVNVRFNTSNIGAMSKKGTRPMAEILCSATAVLPGRSA